MIFSLFAGKAHAQQVTTPIAIVFMSKHGTTQKIANMLKAQLGGDSVTLINLNTNPKPDLRACSRILVGGSIHMGKIQSRVSKFCKKNEALLLSKQLGLFLCCMEQGEKAHAQFNGAFSESLRAHAKAQALMGYELYFERMNFLERSMTRKITGLSSNVSHIDTVAMQQFAQALR